MIEKLVCTMLQRETKFGRKTIIKSDPKNKFALYLRKVMGNNEGLIGLTFGEFSQF